MRPLLEECDGRFGVGGDGCRVLYVALFVGCLLGP